MVKVIHGVEVVRRNSNLKSTVCSSKWWSKQRTS